LKINLERKIVRTADGSTTIFITDWDEHYHSKHGALQEAFHVFIKHGLEEVRQLKTGEVIHIMEVGFGTGLNAFITLMEAEKLGLQINYMGIEPYPVSQKELEALNYTERFPQEGAKLYFELLHKSEWEKEVEITDFFNLHKKQQFFHEITFENSFDLIYFDAFGARVQPELWTEDIFAIMFRSMKKGGVLVTYSAKGSVRRAMLAVGFHVERLPGPPGKREMLRARKL
jgi:tRNA U34 5-methylaminomethyl-2-thiouridine-forming methyltransferase MnmC